MMDETSGKNRDLDGAVVLTTVSGSGLREGIDPSSNRSLYEALDEDDLEAGGVFHA
jgi:hypothetical protein